MRRYEFKVKDRCKKLFSLPNQGIIIRNVSIHVGIVKKVKHHKDTYSGNISDILYRGK